MINIRAKYDIYLNSPTSGIIKAAEAALQEEHSSGKLLASSFRYTQEYLAQPKAFALDPVQLPLQTQAMDFDCRGGGIGLLDDYLPDAWGRKVLTQLAFYKEKRKLNANSHIDMLKMAGTSRIGAIQWVDKGAEPMFELGAEFSRIEEAERAAQSIDAEQYSEADCDEHSLAYLASTGSGVGGARPKALIQKNAKPYLAKFNRLQGDPYNNARIEDACLKMAKAAGINVYNSTVEKGINGREVLLLERFDINGENRNHLTTVNSLLKNPATQADIGGVFRYDDIAFLIKKYSVCVESDLEQLLRVMIFNSAINNNDDHERNFSFINRGDGYQLSPAYDMVPSLSTGQYHAAGYHYQPNPPHPREIIKEGKVFGLSKPAVLAAAEQVTQAISRWPEFASTSGASDHDTAKLLKIIKA